MSIARADPVDSLGDGNKSAILSLVFHAIPAGKDDGGFRGSVGFVPAEVAWKQEQRLRWFPLQ